MLGTKDTLFIIACAIISGSILIVASIGAV